MVVTGVYVVGVGACAVAVWVMGCGFAEPVRSVLDLRANVLPILRKALGPVR